MSKLKIFYSGDGSAYSQPEIMLGEKANLMLTFWGQQKKPNKRMRNILKARREKHGNSEQK